MTKSLSIQNIRQRNINDIYLSHCHPPLYEPREEGEFLTRCLFCKDSASTKLPAKWQIVVTRASRDRLLIKALVVSTDIILAPSTVCKKK